MSMTVSKQQVDAGLSGLMNWLEENERTNDALELNGDVLNAEDLRSMVSAIILGMHSAAANASRFFPKDSDPPMTGE